MSPEQMQQFLARLTQRPQLFERFNSLLEVIENSAGETFTADQAEERVVQEMRQLGQQALQAWAEEQSQKVRHQCQTRLGWQRRGKKNSTGRRA